MITIYVIFGILIVLFSGFLLYKYKTLKKFEKQLLDDEREELDLEYAQYTRLLENQFNRKREQLEQEYQQKSKNYQEKIENQKKLLKIETEKTSSIIEERKKTIDLEIQNYKDMNILLANREQDEVKNKLVKELEKFTQEIELRKTQVRAEVKNVEEELNDYYNTRAAVNAAILREREINEKEEFYKLQISQFDIEDIKYIETIKDKIRNKEVLNKMIYETYYRKPLTELVKRLTAGKSISGIYKITYIPTGEIYIGKSTNIGERWKQHIKSSLNIGTIAHSSLHTYIDKNGIWNFTFEILEEVPKENLTEKEKWYINFYESDKYGLNQKIG